MQLYIAEGHLPRNEVVHLLTTAPTAECIRGFVVWMHDLVSTPKGDDKDHVGYAANTITTYLAALSHYVKIQFNQKLPVDFTLGYILKAIRESRTGERVRKAMPLNMLKKMIRKCAAMAQWNPWLQLNMQTSLLVGFMFMMRISELTAHSLIDPIRDLLWQNVRFYNSRNQRIPLSDLIRLQKTVKWADLEWGATKTDGAGYGCIRAHQRLQHGLCVVTFLLKLAIQAFARGATDTTPVFTELSPDSSTAKVWKPLTAQRFTTLFNLLLIDLVVDGIKVNPLHYSPHSLRKGACTVLFNLGVDRRIIEILGRWATDSKALDVYAELSRDMFAGLSELMTSVNVTNIIGKPGRRL